MVTVQAADKTSAIPVGCLVLKRLSEAGPRFVEYRSYRDFGTNIVVVDVAGDEIRVFSGQGPIFIPYPNDKSADRQKVFALLQLARKTYPDLSSRLALVEKAWAEALFRTARLAAVPRPGVPPPKNAVVGTEIVTTSGTRYSNSRVISVEGDILTIAHDDGVSRVQLAELPEEARKKYAQKPTAIKEGATSKPMPETASPSGISESGKPAVEPAPAAPQPTAPQPASPQPASPQPASPQPASPQPASPQPASPQPASPQPASPQPATQNTAAFWLKIAGGIFFLVLSSIVFKKWRTKRDRPAGAGANVVVAEASSSESVAEPSPAEAVADSSPREAVAVIVTVPSFFFPCPICHGSVEAQDARVGNEIPCPTCTASIKIPPPSNAIPPPPISG